MKINTKQIKLQDYNRKCSFIKKFKSCLSHVYFTFAQLFLTIYEFLIYSYSIAVMYLVTQKLLSIIKVEL